MATPDITKVPGFDTAMTGAERVALMKHTQTASTPGTLLMHGEEVEITRMGSYTQYVYEGAFDLSLVMFFTSSRDYAYVVWDNGSAEIVDYFNNQPYADWSPSNAYEAISSGFEALGMAEDEYSDGYQYEDTYDDDDRYESDGYAMIGGDSDLMNEW